MNAVAQDIGSRGLHIAVGDVAAALQERPVLSASVRLIVRAPGLRATGVAMAIFKPG